MGKKTKKLPGKKKDKKKVIAAAAVGAAAAGATASGALGAVDNALTKKVTKSPLFFFF